MLKLKNMSLAVLACLPLLALADGGNVSKVNGSVRVEAGQTAGDVSTVNGSVTIARNCTVESVETVNGGITLGAGAKAASVETVNGTLRLGEGVRVSGDVSAVNGSASLEKNADVSGELSNVNGKMTLTAAHVGGGLHTVNGDITVGADSRVERGILVEKPSLSWFNRSRREPRIVIGPGAVVEGKLKFEHEVELLVSNRAKIGPVEGAKPVTFSGDEP